ncbi:MAG: hypothetical protein RLN75_06360 [Longimicrobiales bacterium]
MDDRTFTDDEVREILRRAVERPASGAVARRDGVRLSELKAIAAEVGIDPARVEDAAQALMSGAAREHSALLGGARALSLRRTVDAVFDPTLTPDIVSIVRRSMGKRGEVSERAGTVEWSAKGEVGESHVTISGRDGRTVVEAGANLTQAAIVTYLPAGILGTDFTLAGIVSAAQAENLVWMGLMGLVPVGLVLVLRWIFATVSEREEARLTNATHAVADLLEASSSTSSREDPSRRPTSGRAPDSRP